MKTPERRKFHRIQYDGQVKVKLAGESDNFFSAGNLSLTGLFVQGNFQQTPDQDCLIQFVRKEKPENTYLEMIGKVVWSNENGMGVKFTSMKFNNYMLLISTLINNAEQPAIILSEIPKDCPYEIAHERF